MSPQERRMGKSARRNDFIRHFKRFSVTLKVEYKLRIWEKS